MEEHIGNAELDIYLDGLLANQWKLSRYCLDPEINTYNIRKCKAKILYYKYKIKHLWNNLLKKTNT